MDEPLRVACVGDSITFGKGLANRREECYPAVLQRQLGPGGDVRNFGFSGATATRSGNEPYWDTPTFEDAKRSAPQVVLLNLGVNDAQLANAHALPFFEADLRELITEFRQLESRPNVLVGLPAPAFGPRDVIDLDALDHQIRPVVREVSEDLGLPAVDFFSPLAARPELFPDGVHPSAPGARIIAEAAYEALRGGGHLDGAG